MPIDPMLRASALGSPELEAYIKAAAQTSPAAKFYRTVIDSEKDKTQWPDIHVKVDSDTAKALCFLQMIHRIAGNFQQALDPTHRYDLQKVNGALSYAIARQFEFEVRMGAAKAAKAQPKVGQTSDQAKPAAQTAAKPGAGTVSVPSWL
jgi:hypothetical protein